MTSKMFKGNFCPPPFVNVLLSKTAKLLTPLPMLLLMLPATGLNAQKIVSACYEKPEFEAKNEPTLCEQYGRDESDHIVGANPSSTTFASNLGYTTVSSQKITINGKLYLDVSMNFLNARVEFGPGAEIIVTENKMLFGYRSKFYACDYMWRGIMVLPHGRLNLYSSELQDAQYTISAEDHAFLSLLSNRFNRNYVGIRNTNASSGDTGLNFNYFSGNTFICSDPLNAPYSGQTPAPGNISYAGILLDKCVASIGKYNVVANNFSRMHYGIYATHSTVIVQKCTFRQMIGNENDANSATGIYSCDGTLVVKGIFIPEGGQYIGGSTFEDCGWSGIIAAGSNLDIANNAFIGEQEYGIQSGNNLYFEHIRIARNSFDVSEPKSIAGIYIARSTASGTIAHNVIDMNYFEINGSTENKYGVFAGGPSSVAIDPFELTNNLIEVTSTADYIYPIFIGVGNGDKFKALDNVVYFNSTNFGANRYGITMIDTYSGTIEHEISDNVIEGSDTHNPGSAGIHVDNARNVTICNNLVNNTDIGIELLGPNNPCYVKNNQIEAHRVGLFLGKSEVPGIVSIGEQIRHGNAWSATSGDYTDWAAQCGPGVLPQLSIFRVEDDDSETLPTLISPSSGWFILSPGHTNYCSSGPTVSEDLTDLQLETATGSLGSYIDTLSLDEWEMEYALMLTLRNNPDLLANLSALSFYSTNSTVTTAGALSYSMHGLKEAMLPGQTEQEEIDGIHEDIFLHIDTLIELENDYTTAPDTTTGAIDTSFLNAKQQLAESLSDLMDDRQDWKDDITANRTIDLEDLKDFNDTITVVYDYEQNHKTINNYLIKLALGTATTMDYDDIVDIATLQSSDTLSSAIAIARSLLTLCEAFELREEEEEALEIFRPGIVDMAPENFSVYPNPADGSLNILLPDRNAAGKILIRNTDGKILHQQDIGDQNGQRLSVNTVQWPAGIYFCSLFDGSGDTSHRIAFVVTH